MERLIRDHHPNLPEFLQFFSKSEDERVLDLGCGLLPNTKYLTVSGYNVISLDLSLEYLFNGKKIFPKAILVCSDVRFLPFRIDIFDAAIIVDLLEHLPFADVEKVLKETIQVLKNHSYIFLHIPLEGSFAYQFLRLIRKIWTKDPEHKHNFKYWEVKNILKYLPIRIEREWIDRRLQMLKNLNFSAVAVTFVLSVKKIG
ncbi:class I SAM-dependent methyltransferase [candidate division WOR-3 bacterium]|nr:class I SAM-dependent methyltransferase [candidate division WOR-3 bacterium]